MASDDKTANKNTSSSSVAPADAQKKRIFVSLWVGIGAASLIWWLVEGWCSLHRFILVGGLSLAAFMIGCLIGFLFSSHSEESDSIGKVRDWVLGGLSTLTIAKADKIKNAIDYFAKGSGPDGFAIALGTAVAYAALGFFFMYLFRERYLNPDLAQSRKERGQIEGTRNADIVVKTFQVKLPTNLLAGGDDISDVTDPAAKKAALEQKDLLFGPEVNAFLDQVNAAVTEGDSLDWDVVFKVANIQYYRTYFKDDEEEKITQARLAIQWIQRALIFSPRHVELNFKYADMLATAKDYLGSVGILERMLRQPDAPLNVRQYLGYVLLFIRGRAADAIRYANEYRALVIEDTDSLFNIASAYAQAFCEGPGQEPGLDNPEENYKNALEFLAKALQREPDYASVVREKWVQKGESFECFADDAKFKDLVNPKTPAAPAAPPA